jgi:hypothetical protein
MRWSALRGESANTKLWDASRSTETLDAAIIIVFRSFAKECDMAARSLLATLGATACVSETDYLKGVSARQTGCTPDQLTISNAGTAVGGLLWNATCNGNAYLCSQSGGGKPSAEYSCALAQ